MIICLCRGVSDSTVRNLIAQGASCLSALEREGVGNDCRSCESALLDLIADSDDPKRSCGTCCNAARGEMSA